MARIRQSRRCYLYLKIISSISILFVLLLIQGCWDEDTAPGDNETLAQDSQQISFLCPTGDFFHDIISCIPEIIVEQPVEQPTEEITAPKPQKNLDTLGGKYLVEQGNLYHNLNRWSMQEITEGMALSDEIYHLLVFVDIDYNRDLDKEMSYNAGNKKIYDPFYVLRSEKGSKAKESTTVPLRILVFDDPLELIDKVETKRKDSKFKLLYPELYEEWTAINCTQFETCRDIIAVRCTKGLDQMTTWSFNKEPYNTIWRQERYNMQSINDFGRALDAFMDFYCTPV